MVGCTWSWMTLFGSLVGVLWAPRAWRRVKEMPGDLLAAPTAGPGARQDLIVRGATLAQSPRVQQMATDRRAQRVAAEPSIGGS